MKFKDKCDLCNKWDYCKGYDHKVLCPTCIEKNKTKSTLVQLCLFKEGEKNDNN